MVEGTGFVALLGFKGRSVRGLHWRSCLSTLDESCSCIGFGVGLVVPVGSRQWQFLKSTLLI